MRIVVTFLAVLLVGLVGASAYLLLQSCGLRLPFTGTVLSACETDADRGLRMQLEQEALRGADLQTRVTALEQTLALRQCRAEPPSPPPPPPPPKPAPPPKAETPSGLDPDAFKRNDISVMDGCWELSSDYDVRNIRTGEITRFRYWRICFDKNGNGTQVMRGTNGVRCEGPLKGRISGGTLTMREPGKLRCDDGSSIFRRDITCALDSRGRANCDSYQPEINGRGAATLRRARR